MLTSLLPSLRDLRTPLACGFVWLFAGWTWLGSPTSVAGVTGWDAPVSQILARLAAVLPDSALLAVLAFVAYVIGAMFEIDVRRVQRLAPSRVVWRRNPLRHTTRSFSAWTAVTGYWGVSVQSVQDLVTRVFTEFAAHPRAWQPSRSQATRDAIVEVVQANSPRPVDLDAAMRDGTRAGLLPAWMPRDQAQSVWLVSQAILVEAPNSTTRLQISAEKVYEQYDRLVAEMTFRINLAVPLTVLAAVLSTRWGGWWLFFLVVPAALFAQGLLRARRPNDLLVDSVSAGDLTSSVLARAIKTVENCAAVEESPAPAPAPPRRRWLGRA